MLVTGQRLQRRPQEDASVWLSHMGEQTQTLSAGETTTHAIIVAEAQAEAHAQSGAEQLSAPPPSQPQQAYYHQHHLQVEGDRKHHNNPLVDSDPTFHSNSSPSSSKIPFRPRKVRKVSNASQEDALNKRDSGNAVSNSNNLLLVKSRKSVPPPPALVTRTLSCDGEVGLAIRHLRNSDPLLARVIDSHPPPAFQNLHPPFHSLARSILYQQLAFKAAASIYSRFLSLCGREDGVVPEAVLGLTPQQLRQIGVSARKASYLHDLASKYTSGILSDAAIISMDDRSLFSMLTMVKGIGAWSVHMFMIFSLHRPDVLPVGDLGVRKGVQLLYGLEELPRPSQMEQLCERWRPYRSVGSWYMWRLVEGKGSPTTPAVAGPQQQPQLLDPVNALANLG
ncbi:alkylbase DNA glycosidase-like protein mag2 [Aristolochia californica]|uniref:alkylbase DNA glycosidase-like protein mag2 n=1 Tax=Aristolochia californica TaxID=171875 RepID=UPI0035E0203C